MTDIKKPCDCKVSTDITGSISCGTGKLDFNGFWEHPCTHGRAEYLEQKMNEKKVNTLEWFRIPNTDWEVMENGSNELFVRLNGKELRLTPRGEGFHISD